MLAGRIWEPIFWMISTILIVISGDFPMYPHVCSWWVLVHPHVFDVYILYLSPFLMFVYANAGDTGVEENFFFLHLAYISCGLGGVGWGNNVPLHLQASCTWHTPSCYASGCSLALDIGVRWGNNVPLHLQASCTWHTSKSAQRMQRPVYWMETCGIGFTLW